jgi:hypothetical protein
MSFINIFGGATVQPALISYLSINPFTANVTLSWPSQFQDVNNVVANIIDINPSVGGLSITMPDATQTSVGQTVIFNNVGTQTVSILDNTGGGITTIAMGTIYYIYLIDNTTVAGMWRVVPFGLGAGAVVTSVAAVSATTPALTIAGSPITSTGTFTFTLDADLVALDSFAAGTGIAVRTAAGTWALRSIVAGTGTTITNGSGVGGNPQIAVNTNLTLSNLTVGNLNLTGNTISSTASVINIFPAAGQSLLLGSNVSPVTIDTNDNITNVASLTTVTSGGRAISIGPGIISGSPGQLTIGTSINQNINFLISGTGVINFNTFASPLQFDVSNNITNVASITAANVVATTSLVTNFVSSPIARAWVNFTGSTATINLNLNATSVSRTAAGNYTITWSVTAPNTSYFVVASAESGSAFTTTIGTKTTTTTQIFSYVSNTAALTDAVINIAIFY